MMEEVDLADTPLAMRPQLQAQDSASAADDEPPDPRIQVELERLNTSTDLINKLEVDLDEARMMFRQTLLESTQQIDNLTKKLGKCVEQSRPYYEARIKAKQALTEAQKSAVRYERAVSQHAAAREMVHLAEEGLLTRGCIFDSTWQEMLNHATTKVNDAEREKIESTTEHREKSNVYHESETRVKTLQKELKRSIAKSSLNARRSLLQLTNIIRMKELQLLPYFELKAAVNQRLEEQKRHVRELETAVASAKANYSQALSNLETISDQIHKNRQSRLDLGIRGVGVGAESPGPPFSTKNESEIAKQKSVETPIEKTTSVLEQLSHCHDENTNSGTNPISDILPQLSGRKGEGETCQSTVSSKLVVNSSLEGDLKDSSSLKGVKSREDTISLGSNHTNGESGDQHGSYLSGWQFVAFPGLPQNASQSLLSVDDKESVVSDSESLTSIEMLSEEAIANLMLEDEINEASQSICSPHYSEEYLAPPFAKCGTVNHPFVLGITKKPEEKNSSQASSSDSGEQWEVVSDLQEQASAFSTTEQKLCVVTQEDPSIKADLAKEDSENHSKICVNSKSDSSLTGNINDQSVEKTKSPNEANSSRHVSVILDNSDRPQTLPVNSQYLKGGVSSDSSSSLNSNSFSESFSPSYAPLSDTPDMDAATAENPKVEDMSPATSSNDQHNNV